MITRNLLALFLLLVIAASAATNGEKTPRPSPEFAINMNNGSQISLSQYKGKVVVVAFILTYCSHCQFCTQILSKLQNEYGPRGLQVVASATEDMARMAVPDFVRKFVPPFPVGFNNRMDVINYLQHPIMFQLFMPQVVVIDRTGIIRAQFAGDDKFFAESEQEKNFRVLLEPLLKESAVAKSARRTAAHR